MKFPNTLLPLVFAAAVTFVSNPVVAQGFLAPPPAPPGNPVTAEKVNLGKALFWDEQLSSTRLTACGTCHIFEVGGTDPRSILGDPASTHPGKDGVFGTGDDVTGSPGVVRSMADGSYTPSDVYRLRIQVTPRLTMPALNGGYAPEMFWDGRAPDQLMDPLTGNIVLQEHASLESQALGPPMSATEMAHVGRDWNEGAMRIASSVPLALAENVPADLHNWIAGRNYPQLFQEAFGDSAVTPVRIAMAIASYERTLVTNEAPIDAFMSGDLQALTQQEIRGFILFNSTRTNCATCHGGGLFTDHLFHNIGVRPQHEDLGRGGVTMQQGNNGQFKTPSLRNVELRKPYFHNGSKTSLEDVVTFYNDGGDFNGSNKASTVRPLGLSQAEVDDLVAYLGRPLTDPRVVAGAPPFDRPTLYSESMNQPLSYGQATPGAMGESPVMVALEPPMLNNPSLTVGIDRGLGGANAVLIVDRHADMNGHLVRGAMSYLAMSPGRTQHFVVLDGMGAGDGTSSVSFDVPNTPSLIGLTFYGQWFIEDAAGPQGVSASPACEFTLFAN